MGGAVNGGKADNLARLVGFGFAVPRWIALGPDDSADDLGARLASSGLGSAERFAVRSSASAEDGGELSFRLVAVFEAGSDLSAEDRRIQDDQRQVDRRALQEVLQVL